MVENKRKMKNTSVRKDETEVSSSKSSDLHQEKVIQSKVKEEDVVKDNEDVMEREDDDFTFHFFVFSLLYIVGFLVHSRNYFALDVFVAGGLIIGLIACRQFSNQIFLCFLVFCIYSTVESSPYNANHHNMCGFVSFVLVPQQLRRCKYGNVKKAGTAEALNVVRWAIILMYILAGFHKLNTDFFNPSVSCAFNKVMRYVHLLGFHDMDNLPFFMRTVPYQVILVEMIPPIMLCFPKTQRPAILILLSLHTMLLPVGFADFGSIAQSFLWLFVSPQAVKVAGLPKHFYTDLAAWFVFFEAVTLFVWYRTDEDSPPFGDAEVSMVFLAYAIVWASLFRTNHIPGPQVQRPKSTFGVACLLFFFWFAFNPYLGLRTVGCLTMFSNLKTEGPTSNHFILGSNPLKFFGYQDDVIEIMDIDERWEHNFGEGDILPRLAFDFDMVAIKDAYGDEEDFYLWIEYDGKTFETHDLLNDPDFAVFFEERPLWQRKWFDFRVIQQEGPQECHW